MRRHQPPKLVAGRPTWSRFAERAEFAQANLTGKTRSMFLQALRTALTDPQVAPVARHVDWSAPLVRAAVAPSEKACGGIQAIDELSAPLFMAMERPRRLAAEKAPYGLLMGGKTEAEMIARIRVYHRNVSVPRRCKYASCAVVGSSGTLRGRSFGRAIDAHEAVFRINAAPTFGHTAAVGTRTTWRIHNSEKPFMMAASGLPELQAVICHMAWIGSCQHQAFSGAYTDTTAFINPRFYSQLYSLLGRPRDKQSPSTGLLAIALALGVCDRISIFGFGRAGTAGQLPATKAVKATMHSDAQHAKEGPSTGSFRQYCRHYWECVKWEDEAKYYDPLHTFHDWQAEERLRQLWLQAGLIVDGASLFGEESVADVDPTQMIAARNETSARLQWHAVRRQWSRDLRALQRARDARRSRGIGPGQGEFIESTADLLARHGSNASSPVGRGARKASGKAPRASGKGAGGVMRTSRGAKAPGKGRGKSSTKFLRPHRAKANKTASVH